MTTSFSPIIICFIIFFIAIASAISITELVIYGKYKDNNQGCDNDQLISPLTWLLVDGVIGISVSGITIFLFASLGCLLQDGMENIGLVMSGLGTFLLYFSSLFTFAWLIVGSVMFWRDNSGCEPIQLNNTFWAVLIIKLIFTGYAFLQRLFSSPRKT